LTQGESKTTVGIYIGYESTFTGGPRAMHRLATQMLTGPYTPVVLTNKHSPLTEALARDGVRTVVLPQAESIGEKDGQALRAGPLGKAKAYAQVRAYSRRVERALADCGVACLIARNVKGVLLTGSACRRLGIPLIWDIGYEKPARGIFWLLHTLALSRADRVVTQGASVAAGIFTDWQRRHYADKLVVNPNCVAPEREAELHTLAMKTGSPWDPFVVLNVGSIHPRKNQMMLLRALDRLKDRYPQLRIELVGPEQDAAYAAEVHGFVAAHGLGDRVVFHGWCEEVRPFLERSHLFCLTSVSEGVPQSVLEAMHAGLPVLSTRAGGVGDVLEAGETGYVIDVDDVDALTARLADCLDDQAGLEAMGRRAREAAQRRFSVSGWYSRYEDILREVLSSHGAVG